MQNSTLMNIPDKAAMGLETPTFEATMITAEKYRESMCDELDLLNIKTAFLLAKENDEISKDCARFSLKTIKEKSDLLKGEEKEYYKKMQELLKRIKDAKEDLEKIDVKPGLDILETIMKTVKADSDLAKANYYKVFKQY